jgi:uncharacterized cupredoxin-like copper-binding protein
MSQNEDKRYRTYELPIAMLLLAALLVGALMTTNATYAQDERNVVAVELVEYEIRMPTTLPTGPTTFEVTNNGSVDHNFRIEGQGIIDGFANDFPPGQTQILELDLAPGEYEVYSPISDFADQGMRLTLTVNEGGTATTGAGSTAITGRQPPARSLPLGQPLAQPLAPSPTQQVWTTPAP